MQEIKLLPLDSMCTMQSVDGYMQIGRVRAHLRGLYGGTVTYVEWQDGRSWCVDPLKLVAVSIDGSQIKRKNTRPPETKPNVLRRFNFDE